ncbi:hypothetical protein CGMCC3_g768 [Colletotrichum fructicola]|nr:uncharacterized protein CGMCC3_g768 [Colletotrichum fructicola]KAE9583295.1 hypothetical protein CGMCC3_g768 [Colletotrichum fructicola]
MAVAKRNISARRATDAANEIRRAVRDAKSPRESVPPAAAAAAGCTYSRRTK